MTDKYYVGLMSGTSLDGVDAVVLSFSCPDKPQLVACKYQPFNDLLKQELLALNSSGFNEIVRSALAANLLSRLYATSIDALLAECGLHACDITAIGCHGQTIRHRPDLGFTVQIANASLLAELAGITVVSDFRSRDIAAGGQGAPLVPAFHQAMFAHPDLHRVVVNIGGISNLTDLPPSGPVTGFDCGPGNLLMDAWTQHHTGQSYDKNGEWAATGVLIPDLFHAMLQHPFLAQRPPKSTGRDTFNLPWLESLLLPVYTPADVQATLNELAARCIIDAIDLYCHSAKEVYLCGGGVHNLTLNRRLQQLSGNRLVSMSDDFGIGADWVEAAAFAWLARQTMLGVPGNLPAVTGAAGSRVLGAIHTV